MVKSSNVIYWGDYRNLMMAHEIDIAVDPVEGTNFASKKFILGAISPL